jgi:hypothetical protein
LQKEPDFASVRPRADFPKLLAALQEKGQAD